MSITVRLVAFLLFAAFSVARSATPNIVFVLFDDMGYGQPPSYRSDSELKTPNLDRLAREGMRFTDAHTASAVCTPTRYGLLSGRYPWRIGQFGVLTTFSPPLIPPERLTVASLLKQNGYHTACVGKWHLGMNWDAAQVRKEDAVAIGTLVTDGPNAVGFDVFHGFTHARNIGMIFENDRVATRVKPVENQPFLAKKAVAYIDDRARAGGAFFLYLALCPPHTPIVPAPEFIGKSGAIDRVKGDPKYGDWLYQGDAMLGQILDALERNNLARDTLVIATSDNGAEGRAYAPLRGSKRSIYEGGHRVPFVARWPGRVKPGSVNDDTICLNDLMATVAEILGVRLPANAGEDSVSILPDLLGTATGPVREATVHQSMAGDLAIRQGPWKLIFFKNGRRELYNLHTDLGETQDVVTANPDVVERLTRLMQRYVDRGRSTPGFQQKNERAISLTGERNAQAAKKQRSVKAGKK